MKWCKNIIKYSKLKLWGLIYLSYNYFNFRSYYMSVYKSAIKLNEVLYRVCQTYYILDEQQRLVKKDQYFFHIWIYYYYDISILYMKLKIKNSKNEQSESVFV